MTLYSPDYPQSLVGFEGSVCFPYLDSRGNVTIGCGHMVPYVAEFMSLPWGVAFSPDTVRDGWDDLKAADPGMPVNSYLNITPLSISVKAILTLLDSDLAEVCNQLVATWPWIADRPQGPRNAMIDMAFNLGINGLKKYTKFLAFMYAANWGMAAYECHRNGIQPSRNDWTRAQILGSVPKVPRGAVE